MPQASEHQAVPLGEKRSNQRHRRTSNKAGNQYHKQLISPSRHQRMFAAQPW